MKKTMFAVAAAAAITSFVGLETDAQASTYKVNSGDSLWKIANKHSTTVANLKTLNGLSSDRIFPNQVLKVAGQAATRTAPSTSPVNNGSAATYIVKSGDTLGGIANRNNMSLARLMELNSIKGHLIFPGQTLRLDGTAQTAAPSAPSVSAPSQSTTYQIKPGDTLGRIALNNKVTVANLKKWNNLSSDRIFAGQSLIIQGSGSTNGATPSSPAPSGSVNPSPNVSSGVVDIARSLMGVPYVWGGTTPAGFDCSGFIYYVYKQAGYNISRTNAEGQHARSYDVSSPAVGDLVFFENTYKAGISHVGVYIGNNQFIHANDGGVQITSLSNSYWKSKFESFKRFY
ncbi:LysM peptidoglycan-binding domain-containing protein [Jeotgalibacillus soli]|uniref:Peptidoglycan hydrolase n=1 Tax=Jeotgalibacillus soli TaxID=889306 RepID=A0A0C2RI82_9BACL|nr:peptidoglycan endopeptidase [Jeotgalibacillus soli]KIL49870.1 hypothetical protein KP78_13380 [Jeotgalibacillus soli]